MHAEGQKAGVFVLLETRYSEMTGCRKFLIGLSNSGMKPLMDGCRIPFIFKSGGDGPGLGYREGGTVVARAVLPEFATCRVVNSYDSELEGHCRNALNYSLPLLVWMFSGYNRPSRATLPNIIFANRTK